ncbi:PREDICTED: icarapin-like [Wasmannia auropunctata]|uniref:icarapin-like n=1 Tax=Wasmannia auropunctata TaxID=64793 RepID=UPI0005ED50DE|nr:PREDICTED: icarapin-like [Wasmannia auropunctata]
MKTFVHVLLVAACFVACARGFPSGFDSSEEEDFDSVGFNLAMPNFFSDSFRDTINGLRQRLLNYFWNMPDITDIKIPDGANTTSTTKIINGHVVTINETTYTSGDELGGTAFRIRIVDVKPLNDTETIEGNTGEPAVRPESPESRETVEDFNNEISKNTETLTA